MYDAAPLLWAIQRAIMQPLLIAATRSWYAPQTRTNDPNTFVLVSDQGAVVTGNGGKTWSSWYNQPTAQLYNVGVTSESEINRDAILWSAPSGDLDRDRSSACASHAAIHTCAEELNRSTRLSARAAVRHAKLRDDVLY